MQHLGHRASDRIADLERRLETAERALAFVARCCWRTDPPNANNKLTEVERFSAIKYHPTVKKWGAPHIALAELEQGTSHTAGQNS